MLNFWFSSQIFQSLCIMFLNNFFYQVDTKCIKDFEMNEVYEGDCYYNVNFKMLLII